MFTSAFCTTRRRWYGRHALPVATVLWRDPSKEDSEAWGESSVLCVVLGPLPWKPRINVSPRTTELSALGLFADFLNRSFIKRFLHTQKHKKPINYKHRYSVRKTEPQLGKGLICKQVVISQKQCMKEDWRQHKTQPYGVVCGLRCTERHKAQDKVSWSKLYQQNGRQKGDYCHVGFCSPNAYILLSC